MRTKNIDFLEELKNAIKQVNLAKKGKIKLKSIDDFLNEINLD